MHNSSRLMQHKAFKYIYIKPTSSILQCLDWLILDWEWKLCGPPLIKKQCLYYLYFVFNHVTHNIVTNNYSSNISCPLEWSRVVRNISHWTPSGALNNGFPYVSHKSNAWNVLIILCKYIVACHFYMYKGSCFQWHEDMWRA